MFVKVFLSGHKGLIISKMPSLSGWVQCARRIFKSLRGNFDCLVMRYLVVLKNEISISVAHTVSLSLLG